MAADAEVTRLMNSAMARLPGATTGNIQQELFNVMDEFFKASNVWKEDIDVPVPGGDPAGTAYVMAPAEPAIIDKLMWVYTKETSGNTLRGSPWSAAMEIPGELTLGTQPNSTTTLVATVALTVQDPVNRDGYVVFPMWVLQKYYGVILDGVLGKMMSQRNKPWTDTQMTVYHSRKFEGGKAAARVDATHNNTYRQQAWRFPGFVGGSQRGRSGFAQ